MIVFLLELPFAVVYQFYQVLHSVSTGFSVCFPSMATLCIALNTCAYLFYSLNLLMLVLLLFVLLLFSYRHDKHNNQLLCRKVQYAICTCMYVCIQHVVDKLLTTHSFEGTSLTPKNSSKQATGWLFWGPNEKFTFCTITVVFVC